MAASGIAEHNEARRLEGVYGRKAFLRREAERAQATGGERPLSTYDQQVYTQSRQGVLPGCHDAAAVDHQRRQAHQRQMQQEYSAKINNRYTSLDYISQW